MGGACGDGDGGLDAWQGEAPHVQTDGDAGGAPLALDVADGIACVREYEVPDVQDATTWSDGALRSIEIQVQVTTGGVERGYELELETVDFAGLAVPATFAVVAPETDDPPAGSAWIEVEGEWEDAGEFVSFEEAAVSGTLELALLSGAAGADGLVIPNGEGMVGGYFDVVWVDDTRLRASFSVACDSDVDTP